jgi:hypothetical protein
VRAELLPKKGAPVEAPPAAVEDEDEALEA